MGLMPVACKKPGSRIDGKMVGAGRQSNRFQDDGTSVHSSRSLGRLAVPKMRPVRGLPVGLITGPCPSGPPSPTRTGKGRKIDNLGEAKNP